MPEDVDRTSVGPHGPVEAEIGKDKPVPSQETLPSMLGQTPRQQKRIIVIGAVLWFCVAALVLKSYIFGI